MREIKGATRVGWDLEMPTPPGNGPPSHTKLINPLERERGREREWTIYYRVAILTLLWAPKLR